MSVTSTELGAFMVMWLYVWEHLKAQPAVGLVLKCLRRQGQWATAYNLTPQTGEAGDQN